MDLGGFQVNRKEMSGKNKWVLIFIPSYFKWTYGDPSADPSAKLPRPAFLLPREQVQNKSFRELPRSRFFSISLEVLPRSHRELPRKLFLGVAWKCAHVICIYWWARHSDNVFGCTGWRVKNTYYIKVIHSDFELHRWHIHVTSFRMGEPFFMILSSIQMGSGSFNASAWKVCFREASAKNMNTFTKNIPRSWPPCVHHSSCKTYCKYITSYKAKYVLCLNIYIYIHDIVVWCVYEM